MNSSTQERSGFGFAIGLMTGACIGAGLATWLVPRSAAERRSRMAETAARLGQHAFERFEQAAQRVGTTARHVAQSADHIREDIRAVAVLENEGNPPPRVTPGI